MMNNAISMCVVLNLQKQVISPALRTYSPFRGLDRLLIEPNLRWCLVDLCGHVTDGKT